MFELVTSHTPLVIAFVIGTLIPYVYESVLNVFFYRPEQFLNFVNTTLVPRFGATGGKIVLVMSETAVMVIKHIGKTLIFLAKHVFPLVLVIAENVYDIILYSQIFDYIIPAVKASFTFVQGVWGELVFFFSWTTSTIKTEFVRFAFHLALLYFSIHLLIWGIKRMLKKMI